MAFCAACCTTGSVDIPVDDVVDDAKLLPVLSEHDSSAPQFRKVSQLFKRIDRKGQGKLSVDDLLVVFRELEIRIGSGDVAAMMELADENGDDLLDLHEFSEWLCQCRVEERWEEHARQCFALESILLLFWKARTCIVQIESRVLGSIPELELPDAFRTLDLVELIEATEMAVDPIQQSLKFRELAAFAKKTTGNCLGLIDSVVKYREKIWKSTEGQRQFLGLQTSSSPEQFKAAGVTRRIYVSIEAAINLVNIHRKALHALHAINHLFKRLKLCSVVIVTCLQKRRTMGKVLETFMTAMDACQKLAYFEELAIYHKVANDLEDLLKEAEVEETNAAASKSETNTAASKLLPELEKFQRFKGPWKELKNAYEKTRRLAEGYDDWSIKLFNATKVVLYHVCKQYGMEVPGGNEAKDQEASPSIPMLQGFREVPTAAIPA